MIRFFLIGILMQTPILSTTSEGTSISEFDIAIKREKSQSNETDIFKTTVTGKIAESCCQHPEKNSRIILVGRLQIGKYTEEGNGEVIGQDVEHSNYHIVIDSIEFHDYRQNSQTA